MDICIDKLSSEMDDNFQPCVVSTHGNRNASPYPSSSRPTPMDDVTPNPCKVFVGGIGQATMESTLKDHFVRYGPVIDCVIVTERKSGRSRGFGFVTFPTEQHVSKALMDKHKIDDVLVECRRALPRDEARGAAPYDTLYMPSKIFVGGIPESVNEEEFKEFFSQFGHVVDASLAYDKSTHRPRGFGFVVFATSCAVENAVGHHLLGGKWIEAKPAVPREKKAIDSKNLRLPRGSRRRMLHLNTAEDNAPLSPHGEEDEMTSRRTGQKKPPNKAKSPNSRDRRNQNKIKSFTELSVPPPPVHYDMPRASTADTTNSSHESPRKLTSLGSAGLTSAPSGNNTGKQYLPSGALSSHSSMPYTPRTPLNAETPACFSISQWDAGNMVFTDRGDNRQTGFVFSSPSYPSEHGGYYTHDMRRSASRASSPPIGYGGVVDASGTTYPSPSMLFGGPGQSGVPMANVSSFSPPLTAFASPLLVSPQRAPVFIPDALPPSAADYQQLPYPPMFVHFTSPQYRPKQPPNRQMASPAPPTGSPLLLPDTMQHMPNGRISSQSFTIPPPWPTNDGQC
eukprot:GHVO01006285.1.p1 GENE.GHVO01006285.1~~GHVO01006285.1.p1  ORF type:complete len:566 (+),score=60.40 GHVO01006285.1:12-1709(+)